MDFKAFYLSWRGRINRREYALYFLLPLTVFNILLAVTAMALTDPADKSLKPLDFAFLLTIYPSLCIHAKRLHDINKSGWWQLLPGGLVLLGVVVLVAMQALSAKDLAFVALVVFVLAALVGSIWLFVWLTRKSDAGDNRFGPPSVQPDFKTNAFRYILLGIMFLLPVLVAGALFLMSAAFLAQPPAP